MVGPVSLVRSDETHRSPGRARAPYTPLMESRVRDFLAGVRPVDVVLATALFGIGMLDALTTTEYGGGSARLAVAVTLQTLPLALRRTRTLLAVGLSLTGLVVEIAGVEAYGGVYGLLGFLLLVHATARWTRGPSQRTAVALLVVGAVAQLLSQPRHDGPLGVLGDVVVGHSEAA